MSRRPNNEGDGVARHWTEAEISERFVSLVDQVTDLAEWKHKDVKRKDVKRMAVLLDEIKCRHKIIKIVNAGFHDLWLPLPKGYEPSALEPAALQRYRQKQSLVLADEFEVNDSGQKAGCHANLTQEAIDWTAIPKTLENKMPLGEGGFGTVTKVVYTNSNKAYALKTIERKQNSRDAHEQMRYIKMELDVLRRIRHCHYIRLVASYTEPKHIGILMDPVADCNLQKYLEDFQTDRSREPILAGFFGCLATALAYLQNEYNIRHKDIKPQNILVHGNNILLTDFGIALDWSESGITTTHEEKQRSPIYCAPEVAEDKPRNSMSDIWSLGCVFLEMAAVLRGHQWSSVRETMETTGDESIRYYDNLPGIKNVLDDLRQSKSSWGDGPLVWVEQMLCKEKTGRPTSRQLREMILNARTENGQKFCGLCCATSCLSYGDEDKDEKRGDSDDSELSETSGNQRPNSVLRRDVLASRPQYVQIHDPSLAEWSDVKLTRDKRALKNWVAAHIVERFHLEVELAERTECLSLDGLDIRSTSRTSVTWMEAGEKRTRFADFFVVPVGEKVPFELLIAAAEGC